MHQLKKLGLSFNIMLGKAILNDIFPLALIQQLNVCFSSILFIEPFYPVIVSSWFCIFPLVIQSEEDDFIDAILNSEKHSQHSCIFRMFSIFPLKR